MSTDTKTPDLAELLASQEFTIEKLAAQLANMPALDQERIQQVLAKLDNDEVEMLGNEQQVQASALRIAQKIIDESAGS